MNRPRLTIALFLSAAAVLAAGSRAASAQDTSPEVCPAFREMAQAAVPAGVGNPELMRRLLGVRVGPQLGQSFDVRLAERAVGDQLRPDPDCRRDQGRTAGRSSASDACFFRNERSGSVLYSKPDVGRVTYLNPGRRFAAARGVDNPVTDEAAQRTALAGLAAIGLPREEIGRLDVRALMAATQDAALATRTQVLRAEVHVNLTRQVGGTPVAGSRTVTAIDADGQIARLYVEWPDFRFVPGLTPEATRPRAAVVEDVVEKLAESNPCGTVGRVLAHVAYVPSSFVRPTAEDNAGGPRAERSRGYVPALVVFVVPPEGREGQIGLAELQLAIPLLATRSE